MIECATATVPITLENLPEGNLYEKDGSCWHAIIDVSEPKGWRWQLNNWTAFAKGEPEGEMSRFIYPMQFRAI